MEDYDRFKRLCDAHGFSTRQVAKKIGADPSTFSHWKKGDYVPRYVGSHVEGLKFLP